MQKFLTRFLLSPYLDQNVTLHVDFCPVCLLKTEHDENGGEYRCRETAGFIALGFSTRCKPSESWMEIIQEDYFKNIYTHRIVRTICANNFIRKLKDSKFRFAITSRLQKCDRTRHPCSKTSHMVWYEISKFRGSCSFIAYLIDTSWLKVIPLM